MIEVTRKQNSYLQYLDVGAKTTRELMELSGFTMSGIEKMIGKLRGVGLVRSTKLQGVKGNINKHELVKPYSELIADGLVVVASKNERIIPDVEIEYAAGLRNAGLTGQRLSEQFNTRFPDRNEGGIKNIVLKARRRGLCR